MTTGIIITVIIIVLVILIISKGNKQAKDLLNIQIEGEKSNHFNPTKEYREAENHWCLAIDSNTQEILHIEQNMKLLRKEGEKDFEVWRESFLKIKECELLIDDIELTKSSTGNIIAGAIVGGGIGALIGSQINKKGEKEIKKIELKFVIKDIEQPIRKVTLFEPKMGYPSLKEALALAEEWLTTVQLLLNKDI